MIHSYDLVTKKRNVFILKIFSVAVFASLINVVFWIFYFHQICWNVKFESLCPYKNCFYIKRKKDHIISKEELRILSNIT